MKIIINIEKKFFYIICVMFFLFILAIVTAFNTSNPANFGHSSGEVLVSFRQGRVNMTLQEAIDNGVFKPKKITLSYVNCSLTDTVSADRPYYAVASCPTGKYLAGWNCYWSENTRENEEIIVYPTSIAVDMWRKEAMLMHGHIVVI